MSEPKVKKSSANSFTVFSIAIVLYVLMIYLLLSLHTSNLTNYFKEQVSFVIELTDSVSSNDVDKILAHLSANPNVIHDRTEYLSKEKAVELMAAELADESIDNENNPFKPLIVFYLNSDSYGQSNIEQLEHSILEKNMVEGFYYQKEVFSQLSENLKKINWIFLFFVGILAFLMLIVIINTIRFKLQNNRFQIKTMEMVGAEKKYINQFYQKQVFGLGINAILLAIFLLVLTLLGFYLKYESLHEFLQIKWLIISVIIASLVGLFLIWITTKVQIDKYLSKHFYELY